MSEHKATLKWKRGDADFRYKEFPKDHDWLFPVRGNQNQ